MDARVIALVEEDLEHGLMPGEINDYTLLPAVFQLPVRLHQQNLF